MLPTYYHPYVEAKRSILIFALLIQVCFSLHSQEVCHHVPGIEMHKPGNTWLSLSGTTIWSSDDLACWTSKHLPELDRGDKGKPASMAFFDADNGILVTASYQSIHEFTFMSTNDGGESWTELDYSFDDNCAEALSSGRLYPLSSQSILLTQVYSSNCLISHDRGKTWECMKGPRRESGYFDIEIVDENTWYIPSVSGLLKTTDQGASYDTIATGAYVLVERDPTTEMLYAISGDHLIKVANNGTISEKINLPELIPELGFMSNLILADDYLYLFSSQQLYYSSDFGHSWNLTDVEGADLHSLVVSRVDGKVFTSRGRLLQLNCLDSQECDLESVDDQIIAYPNPTDGKVQFNTLCEKVIIMDATGKIIYQKEMKLDPVSADRTLDLAEFPPGIYLLLLQNENNSIATRVVKL